MQTRLSHSEPISAAKMRLYEHTFLPAMRAQIFRDFDLFVIVDSDGECNMQSGSPENLARIKARDASGLRVHYVHARDCPRTGYHITFRVDADDWVAPTFVLRGVDMFSRIARKHATFILSYHHYLLDAATGDIHRNPYRLHDAARGNMPSGFCALCTREPNADPRLWPYDMGRHWKMHMPDPKAGRPHRLPVFMVDDGLCVSVIHNANLGSKVQGRRFARGVRL